MVSSLRLIIRLRIIMTSPLPPRANGDEYNPPRAHPRRPPSRAGVALPRSRADDRRRYRDDRRRGGFPRAVQEDEQAEVGERGDETQEAGRSRERRAAVKLCDYCRQPVPPGLSRCPSCSAPVLGEPTPKPLPDQRPASGMKHCPLCAEQIDAAATKCPFCGTRFPDPLADQVPSDSQLHQESSGSQPVQARRGVGCFGLAIGLLTLTFFFGLSRQIKHWPCPASVDTMMLSSS